MNINDNVKFRLTENGQIVFDTGKEEEVCKFDTKEGCKASACYANYKCNSRDEKGNPMYFYEGKEETKAVFGITKEESEIKTTMDKILFDKKIF
jgi:hypothetical protein